MFQGDNFSDMPDKADGIYTLFVFLIHGFAAVTSFLFGYRFLRLFGLEATVSGLSLDGVLSGVICTLLVDGMCLAMSRLYLRHADTPMQMQIAKTTYWTMITISGSMSLVYLGAIIADYQGQLDPVLIETGQWLVALVSVLDLFIGAAYSRSGAQFGQRLQEAQHNAAMAVTMAKASGEIQYEGRQRAKQSLLRRKGQLSEHIANGATNRQIAAMQHRPAPQLVRIRERTQQSPPETKNGDAARFQEG